MFGGKHTKRHLRGRRHASGKLHFQLDLRRRPYPKPHIGADTSADTAANGLVPRDPAGMRGRNRGARVVHAGRYITFDLFGAIGSAAVSTNPNTTVLA